METVERSGHGNGANTVNYKDKPCTNEVATNKGSDRVLSSRSISSKSAQLEKNFGASRKALQVQMNYTQCTLNEIGVSKDTAVT